eukprot:3862154-Pyramimonas_sp.AAC.1
MAARLSTPGRGGCKADSARDWKVAVGVWGVWGVQVMVAATAGDAIGVAHQQGALNLLVIDSVRPRPSYKLNQINGSWPHP